MWLGPSGKAERREGGKAEKRECEKVNWVGPESYLYFTSDSPGERMTADEC